MPSPAFILGLIIVALILYPVVRGEPRRRQSRAIRALAAVSDAKDAVRQARVRGDTRKLHEAEARLRAARTAQLRAEIAMERRA